MMKHQLLSLVILAVLLSFPSTALTAQSEPEQLSGEGAIVAFQKYDHYRVKPYQRGTATYVEEWIVRIDKWATAGKKNGYFLVTYEKVAERVFSDREMNHPKWRFTFREPRFHEAESCAGSVTVPSKDGKSYRYRSARMADFQRTKAGLSDSIPPLKDLPCLIANEPPTVVKAQQERSTLKLGYVRLKGRVLAEATLFPLGTLDLKYTAGGPR